jgi:hypothetical protein
MMVAWIIWGEIDAVRSEWNDYRNHCADWVFENDPIARTQIGQIGPQKGSWHLHQWKPSGWNGLYLRASWQKISTQVAINSLWLTAGEDRIKATALEYENAKAFVGNPIEIPAHYWPHLKRADDPSSGKAMLSGPDGRVYREVQFPQLDGKRLWPKSPPLSGEPLEPGAVEVMPEPTEPERVEAPEQTRTAERELMEPKARPTPATASKKTHPQRERAARHIARLYSDRTDGISSEVIRKKLEKDPVLLAELAEQGGKPPSRASIDRARGLRR